MAAIVPLVKLADGTSMPILGLGTWKSKPGDVYTAVKHAILEAGYRHIDCAYAYQNEDEVGNALKECIESGAVTREELFITSKCWNTFHSYEKVSQCLDATLKALQLEYVDLWLIHWPFGYQEDNGVFPRDEAGNIILSDVDFMDTWRGMEQEHLNGRTKSIGLSNFNAQQIARILESAKVKPVVNQVECHPYLNQAELITFCKSHQIQVEAYSPLGSPDRPWAKTGDPLLLEEPKIVEIAEKYNKSPAQVLIRYQVQRGIVVIPKSVTPERITSNIQVFDFELSGDDLETINSFNRNHRFLALEHVKAHKYYPF